MLGNKLDRLLRTSCGLWEGTERHNGKAYLVDDMGGFVRQPGEHSRNHLLHRWGSGVLWDRGVQGLLQDLWWFNVKTIAKMYESSSYIRGV